MNPSYFTILIIISNLTIGQCRTVTYNNVNYDNRKIQNNQTRKLNEYHSKLHQGQENAGKSHQSSIKTLLLNNNKLDFKNRIRNPNQLLKYLMKRYHIHKKSSPYTLAIFKDEKSKEKFPTHTLVVFKPNSGSNQVEELKGKFPSHTLAIFEPNPDSNQVELSKPYKINLTEDQFILPEIDDDTREGEVFLNNDLQILANNPNADSYQVDDSLKQEYYTIDENEILSFSSNDSSYFPDSYQFNDTEQYRDNFTGYPESHQVTSTTEFSGYFYQAPGYLPPAENGVILLAPNDINVASNDTKNEVVKVKEKDLFAHYYVGYKFWYAIVIFTIYHTIMMGYYYLVTLVKHYSKFPAALQAAVANS